MPPWYIERDIGIQEYKGDISLTDEEIGKIAAWADSGAPRGEAADAASEETVAVASDWQLGQPDLVLKSPSIEVAPTAPDWWGPMGEVETGLTEDRYVSSIEMREVSDFEGEPERDTIGGLYVIHHLVIIPVGPEGTPDPNDGFWPVHEVGRNPDEFHPESGKLLRAGSKILFPSAHLHSNGRHTRAHLEIGLKFHPEGYEPTRQVQIVGPATMDLDIKPMEADQEFEAYTTLLDHAKLTVYEPHMHAAGVRMCLDTIWANRVETLSCAGYNHNWVRVYSFEDHVAPLLPKGTIHHPAHPGLLRQHADQPERLRPPELVRPRPPVDRQHDDQHRSGRVHERRGVRGRSRQAQGAARRGAWRAGARLPAVRL